MIRAAFLGAVSIYTYEIGTFAMAFLVQSFSIDIWLIEFHPQFRSSTLLRFGTGPAAVLYDLYVF